MGRDIQLQLLLQRLNTLADEGTASAVEGDVKYLSRLPGYLRDVLDEYEDKVLREMRWDEEQSRNEIGRR